MSASSDTERPMDVDALITATSAHERKLLEGGFAEAHEWMFGLREVLYDLRRFEKAVAAMLADDDISRAPERIKDLVNMMLYEIIPHSGPHMEEVDESLSPYLPEDPDEEEEDDASQSPS